MGDVAASAVGESAGAVAGAGDVDAGPLCAVTRVKGAVGVHSKGAPATTAGMAVVAAVAAASCAAADAASHGVVSQLFCLGL